jgi:predicted AlkP superfamily pyrophosphatase or phosphodiesterase
MTRRRMLAIAASLLGAAAVAGAQEPRHVVMVSVDGLMADYYVQADALGLKVPTLRRLMQEGAWARGVTGVLPTVTYPSHTTLITGVPPRVHGIFFNTIFDPEERSSGAWYYYANAIRVPTLLGAAKASGLRTGAVSWPVTVGSGADFLIPEFSRPGATHEIDKNLLEQLSTPNLIDAVEKSSGRRYGYPPREDDRMAAALHILKAHQPRLMLLHLIDPDGAQHRNGPKTAEALQAVEEADANLGRLIEATQQAGTRGRTLFAIVSDHGFLPTGTFLRPNALLREAGLLSLNEQGRVREWKAFFHASGGSAALHLKDPGDAATLERVRALIAAKAKDPASGIRDVLGPEQVRGFGGADSEVVLNAREKFYFQNTAAGEWSAPGNNKGGHGYAPDRPELHSSLILSGPGLKKKGDLGIVRMTQIAPTLAQYLGLSLAKEADAPLPVW